MANNGTTRLTTSPVGDDTSRTPMATFSAHTASPPVLCHCDISLDNILIRMIGSAICTESRWGKEAMEPLRFKNW